MSWEHRFLEKTHRRVLDSKEKPQSWISWKSKHSCGRSPSKVFENCEYHRIPPGESMHNRSPWSILVIFNFPQKQIEQPQGFIVKENVKFTSFTCFFILSCSFVTEIFFVLVNEQLRYYYYLARNKKLRFSLTIKLPQWKREIQKFYSKLYLFHGVNCVVCI